MPSNGLGIRNTAGSCEELGDTRPAGVRRDVGGREGHAGRGNKAGKRGRAGGFQVDGRKRPFEEGTLGPEGNQGTCPRTGEESTTDP